jgi:alpha-L-rhamnosidase
MYNYSLGIQRSPEKAAFKQIILKPTPDPDKVMTFAKGYYDSMYGRISSEWKIENGKWVYKCTVPANTTATLHLPAQSLSQVKESGKSIVQWVGAKQANGEVILPLGSGEYLFEIKE